MSAHTPGPWRWTAIDDGWDGVTSEHGTICRLVLNTPINAALIAAAPDLLVALRDLMLCIDEGGTHVLKPGAGLVEYARAAIAKATGQEVPV